MAFSDEVRELQSKCDAAEWSLQEDSKLCQLMENYWSHYRGQVDDLKSKIARISRLSAILNSGLVNLNGAVTCIANSRFVEQRLGEDESPKILPSDQNGSCDGRADTVATLSAAIRRGVESASLSQNMIEACSTCPVIGSEEFMNVWIHKRADQTVCNASPASITPSSSRPESSLHSRDDSKEIGNIPIPIPTEVAESSPTIGIQSRGALAHDEADLRNFPISTERLIAEPRSTPTTAYSGSQAEPNSRVLGIAEKSEEKKMFKESITGGRTNRREYGGQSAAAKYGSIFDSGSDDESLFSGIPKPKTSGADVKGTAKDLNSGPGTKSSIVEVVTKSEEKAEDVDSGFGTITAVKPVPKSQKVEDSDSEPDTRISTVKPVPKVQENVEDMMEKAKPTRKLEKTNFIAALNERLAKGPVPAVVSKSVPKTVADPDVPKNVPKAAEEPEISKTVPKSVTGSKVQVRKQEEDSNVPPTGPLLPSLTKTRTRGPARRPPSSRSRESVAGVTPAQTSSSVIDDAATNNSRRLQIDSLVEQKRRDRTEKDSVTVAPGLSTDTEGKREKTTPSRAGASKLARSFFDSDSDSDDSEAEVLTKDVGEAAAVSSSVVQSKKPNVLLSDVKESSSFLPRSSTDQKAAATKPTVQRFSKGLFDDDESDDDLSMFRSKPRNA